MSIKYAQEVVNLQQQLHNMMLTIHQMNDKIKFLEEAIENIVKTNIEEIVAVVASSIESKKKNLTIKMCRLLNTILTVKNVVSIVAMSGQL